ncbi:hypothetical protein KAFR_0L01330 [Kazachstania africana CBS 2517]|uniref:CHCH domain-containing protein n=1 Tax=Kazachstania africana (strain ATCC 22294 / BCRC 22015 / CBS 2517 / CECT 1963 / NBRC 1671 / NRRL Y-8276) TaxID=1071382 RepID=H2B292_KAZAF|nr:hypothetical protein KAFR_0L01330 [Kazachstania africana CBS 2517]CCF60742.1 hypothetical protein KAFR_0L01330 [Kazachstania africana CBS 2517]
MADKQSTGDVGQSKYYQEALQEYKDLMQDDEEPDTWDVRINKTGCYIENMALQLCRAETGDWRQCMLEMNAFRKCWELHGNRERVHTVDKEEFSKQSK